jgi:hypothetical protein
MLAKRLIGSFGHAGSKSDRCIFSFRLMWQVSELNRLLHPWILIFQQATQRNSLVQFREYLTAFREQVLLRFFWMRMHGTEGAAGGRSAQAQRATKTLVNLPHASAP